MTRSSRRTSSLARSEESDATNDTSFSFCLPILSTIKRTLSNKEQLNRLVELHEKISILEDDQVDLETLRPISKDLINKKLLNHASIGVQAFVCCCISDILRLFAPNAPYTDEELSDIFKAFLKQFQRISSSNVASAKSDRPQFYPQYVYLLKRIAETKTFVLMLDLPDSQFLVEEFFDTFYGIATRESFPKELETIVSDVLTEITTEAEMIPHRIVKLILSKFNAHESGKSILMDNIATPEFAISLAICEANVDRMSRSVAQYFSEILYKNSNMLEQADEQQHNPQTDKKMNGKLRLQAIEVLQSIHYLSVQIWSFVPSIMSSVMALLEDELNASEDKIRALATSTIGQMLGTKSLNAVVPLLKVNPFTVHKSTWQTWLKKSLDISSIVRSLWVTLLPNIVQNNQYLTTEINKLILAELKKCLMDSDHRVREAACRTFTLIPFEVLVTKYLDNEILSIIIKLMREKHRPIRNTAMEVTSSLYADYVDRKIESRVSFDENIEKAIKEIPKHVISLIYINDKDVNAMVDTFLFDKLAPFNETNAVTRVQKLLYFYKELDTKSKEAFLAINSRQRKLQLAISSLMEVAEAYFRANTMLEKENKPSSEEFKKNSTKLQTILTWITQSFPEDYNTYACLERLVKLNRARFLHLIKTCISSEADLKTINSAMNELLTKLSETKNIKSGNQTGVTPAEMRQNVKLLLLRGSPLIYNKSNIEQLIAMSKSATHEHFGPATEILQQISNTSPEVFKNHIRSLTDLCMETTREKSRILRATYHFVKIYPDAFPPGRSFTELLKKIAISGTPQEAKYALKLIGKCEQKEVLCASIVDKIYPLNIESEYFATHLSSIAEIFLIDKYAIMDKEEELTPYVLKHVLLENSTLDVDATFKTYAIRLFINILKSAASDTNHAKEKAAPVLKLLISIIGNMGEIVNKSNPSWPTPETYKQQLRLNAGKYLLKLAKIPIYNDVILSPTMRKLCFLVNDNELEVRKSFFNDLKTKLAQEAISDKYLSLVFFSALEVDPTLKKEATMWINSMFKRCEIKKSLIFEKSLVRLVHSIAHHETFVSLLTNKSTDELNEERYVTDQKLLDACVFASVYLTYYVQLIAKQENISLLYYLASRIKQHRDASIASSEYTKKKPLDEINQIYQIAELAQLILKTYSDIKNWPIHTWSDKIKLPQELFAPMGTPQEAQLVVSRIFIEENVQIPLVTNLRKQFTDGKKRLDSEAMGRSSEAPNVKKARTAKSKPRLKSSRTKTTPKANNRKKAETALPTRRRRSTRIVSKNVRYKDQLSSSEEEEEEEEEEKEENEEEDQNSDSDFE